MIGGALLLPVSRQTDQQRGRQGKQHKRANGKQESREGGHQDRASKYGDNGEEVACGGGFFRGFIHAILLLPS